MSRLNFLPNPFFALAPMDDVTDTVFRQIVAKCCKPDLFFTEFVNADGLQSLGREGVIQKLKFTESDQPIIAQIWGLKPENFYKTARELVELGFSGVDLNFGCPDKTVVKNGACSALINNRSLATEIIQATKEGVSGRASVSVKTRLGFEVVDLSWAELLLDQGVDMLTIHGRTRKELSKVPAHWEDIGRVRKMRDDKKLPTLIVGNGDVTSRKHGEELAQKYSLDGIMIGRGVFNDPFVFSSTSPWQSYSRQQKIALYSEHVRLFAKIWEKKYRPIRTLNKFCKIYVNGYEGAKGDREKIMAAVSTDELLLILHEMIQS